MATHMGCEYTIVVLNEEGRYDTKEFWREPLVDSREPVQCKADVCCTLWATSSISEILEGSDSVALGES